MRRTLLFALCALSVSLMTAQGDVGLGQPSTAPDSMSPIIKPALDTLQYKIVVLENGLKVILIHDPETDKAAAALDVSIGSLLDPDDCLGLAHFTEHMLFFSSAKYPEEDAYSKFVTDHGGSTNAYTASENTNYHFDVNWEHLEPALDRFAQFFVCPTISADGVSRELKAVDSEHGKNLAVDVWRQMQLHKHTANAKHPWARFATGNLDTLRDRPLAAGLDVRQAVVDFHNRHYSANLMRLVVIGRHSLVELEELVRAKFSAVPSHSLERPVFGSDLFLPEHCGQLCRIIPVREGQSLEFAWQIPPSIKLYRQAPTHYLSHLLGHEGEGSVFALLKALGWATSLVSGESGVGISSAAFFYVRVDLTEEGHQHVVDVGTIVFKYLELLRAGGVQESIWQEMRSLAELRFNFRDKMSPYNYVTSLSAAAQEYPDQDVLLAMYHVPQTYDAECIKTTLKEMTLDKVRVSWVSKKHDVSSVEPWYGTKYDLAPLPGDWLAAWTMDKAGDDERLYLPDLNPFIPTDFTLRETEAAAAPLHPVPVMLVPEQICLWHKCDVTFKVPKAVIHLDFQMPESYTSPDSAVMTRLYVKLLVDYLNEMAYPAELAGLSYSVSNSQTGFTVVASGYNHKLRKLVDAILDKIATFQVLPDRFAVMREETAKEYANMKYQQPYQWAMYRRELLMQHKRWRVEEYEVIAAEATPRHLTEFVPRMMSRVYVEGLAVGNIAASEAVELAAHVQDLLRHRLGARPLFPSQMRDLRAVALPAGGTSLYSETGPNPSNDNSAALVVYQAGQDDLHRSALVQLAVQLFQRDAFHELRTVQQLGYIVSMFASVECGVYNLMVVVQSNAFSAQECSARIDAFVQQIAAALEAKCAPLAQGDASGPGRSEEGQEEAPRITDSVAGSQEMTDSEVARGDVVEVEAVDAPPSEPSAAPEGDPGGVPPPPGPLTEFDRAVAELAKAKLERPKRLGELSQRWWNEVFGGGLRFDRREAEVEQLRRLTPEDMKEFLLGGVLTASSRRQLVVQIRGSAELKKQEAHEATAAGDTCASASSVDSARPMTIITDISSFKRSCSVHPAVIPHLVPSVPTTTPLNISSTTVVPSVIPEPAQARL